MDKWMLSLLSASFFVGLLVLFIKLLSPFLTRRTAARWRYWVWLALAVRLLLPFSIPAEKAPLALEVPSPQITFTLPPAQGGAAAPEAEPDPGIAAPTYPPQSAEIEAPGHQTGVSIFTVMGAVWLAGAVIAAGYQTARGIRFRRRLLRWGRPPRKDRTRDLFEKERTRAGASKNVVLLISENAPGPVTFGLFKPVLVLPDETLPAEDLQLVLRHELTHQKRGDLWYKLAVLAAATVHWFNPLCWLLYREASADVEQRCDDTVLAGSGTAERRLYSEVILASVQQRRRPGAGLTTCFYGGKKRLRLRFENILRPGLKKGGALLTAFCLTAVLLSGVLVACNAVPLQGPPAQDEEPGAAARQEIPEGFYPVTLTFPTEEQKKTQNSELLESHAFQFSVLIPENWELRPEALTKYDYVPETGYEIWEKGGHLLGRAFCSVFEMVPDVPRESYWEVAYSSIRLGSMVDCEDYRPLVQQDTFESGICHYGYISREAAEEYGGRMPDAPWSYNWDAMAFDTQREVFVVLAVDDGETTEEEMTFVAKSAAFSGELPAKPKEPAAASSLPAEQDDGLLEMDFSWVKEDLYDVPAGDYAAPLAPLYKFYQNETNLFDPAFYRLTLKTAPGTPSVVSIKLVYHLAPDIATSLELTAIFDDGVQRSIGYQSFPDLEPLTPLEELKTLTEENNRQLGLSENDGGAPARYFYDFREDILYYLPFAPDTQDQIRLT
ncbi:MAG: M56 family metallopeptidase [Oscillospiraceae bacterium]|nr:M56 family metallopeptidase [Oscillospiraceae bacterium]